LSVVSCQLSVRERYSGISIGFILGSQIEDDYDLGKEGGNED
jgi:hypothetical protein